MATRLRSTTTADILHECLIQKIISYLSFQEAAKMSILSKTWLQAWFTHPNLEFRVHCCKDFETVDKILARYRDRKIPINKFKFWNFSDYNSSKVFPLLDKWLGIAIQNGVRDLLYRDLSFSRSLHGILETGIEKIDAPTVVSIEYKGDRVSEHKIAKESNQLKHSEIVPHCSNNLNAAWFCKLRNFLSNLTSLSQVSLYFVKCNDINMKDLQLRHSVPAAQLDVLNVDIRSFETCPTFVDALLWSCHPRRLNVHSEQSACGTQKWGAGKE
ncbi:hypothetical protein RND71_031393 [Anisodus tanguticus]|uniref:F-box domain-containing protein n=1 Tax=Anisodus tanguticus TaxID=243964 RepID=A0AAE1UXF9_9SOLA|nr:hypothetical protein RND71_031393 [Anisodus tanguticus]